MPKRNEKSGQLARTSIADIEPSSVSSVVRAAGILVCLSNGIDNVTDLAKCCHLSKSTVHRLLKTLEEPRFVVYDSVNHHYYLGPLVTQLASNPKTTHQYLIISALDEMKYLSGIAEETVTLTGMMGVQMVNLYEIESRHGLKVAEGYGADVEAKTLLLPIGALQKVLLSQLDNKGLDSALKSIMSWAEKDLPIANVEHLKWQLKQIKEQGYAISTGERIAGAICLSAAIKNYYFPVALSILGPENRLAAKVPILVKELKAGTDRISSCILKLLT